MKKRRTTTITLVLIASVTIISCSKIRDRHVYKNLQDCVYDWSNPALCQPIVDNSYPRGYYLGPYYEIRDRQIYQSGTSSGGISSTVNPSAGILKNRGYNSTKSVAKVSRGGFGSSGKSFGSSRG